MHLCLLPAIAHAFLGPPALSPQRAHSRVQALVVDEAAAVAHGVRLGSTIRRPIMSAAAMEAPIAPVTWSPEADHTWIYDGSAFGASESLTVNYIVAGPPEAPPLLLVHGFGASGFHWRRNINVLAAAGYRVYAIDLIGFGLSSKPIIDYDAKLWRDQCAAFLREVAGCGGANGKRALIAGNSIGGYTALSTASAHPELVAGVASLNGAGSYSPTPAELEAQRALEERLNQRSEPRRMLDEALERLGTSLARAISYIGLFVTKQPLRIQQVLRLVYPSFPYKDDPQWKNLNSKGLWERQNIC